MNQSAFNSLLELATIKDHLYMKETEVDELHEIANHWIDFASKAGKHLQNITKLVSTTYSKNVDQFTKGEVKDEAFLEVLYDQQAFLMKLSSLIYSYSLLRKEGLFGFPGKQGYELSYLEGKEILDMFILQHLSNQVPITPDVEKVITVYSSLEQERRSIELLRSFLETDPNLQDIYIIRSGKYHQAQAQYLSEILLPIVQDMMSAEWWQDHVLLVGLSNHIKSHYSRLRNTWIKGTLRLRLLGEAVYMQEGIRQDSLNLYYLAQHYHDLALIAFIKQDFTGGLSYQGERRTHLENALKLISSIKGNSDLENLYKDELQDADVEEGLSRLAATVHKSIPLIEQGKIDAVRLFIDEGITVAQKLSAFIDKPFIGALAPLYQSIFLELKNSNSITKEKITKLWAPILQQMMQAVDEATKKTVQYVKSTGIPADLTKEIKRYIETLKYLELSVSLIPLDIPERKSLISTMQILINALYGKMSLLKSTDVFFTNPTRDLILKAKAHAYFQKSIAPLSDAKPSKELLELEQQIELLAKESFAAGLISEGKIRIDGLQFKFINEFQAIFVQLFGGKIPSTPSPDNAPIVDSIKREFKLLEPFMNELQILRENSKTLLENKTPLKLRGKDVNWAYFAQMHGLANALYLFIKSVEEAFLGWAYWFADSEPDAKDHFDKAKEFAYESSNNLSQIQQLLTDPNLVNLPDHVFSFGQLMLSFASGSKDITGDIPIEQILDLIHVMVMSL